MAKKIRKRISRRKLNPEDRKRNAKKWLAQPHRRIVDLSMAYGKRYKVSIAVAHLELEELGYKEQLTIHAYEKEGIEWEYKYDGYTGRCLVVPVGTPDWELYHFY
ncbi:MAG: hypothetical protein HY787_10410 [Deltaproteobacteria bacterium]|nr:hypothetical protein [Deltaproteobacteria bacterium]